MGWGTNYKYTGYLPDIGKDEVYSEKRLASGSLI